jgi:hypothetical protein
LVDITLLELSKAKFFSFTNKKSMIPHTMSKNHKEIGNEIGKLVEEKQIAYGDSFGKAGKVLEILYPNGIKIEDYQDVLTMVRIIDKLFRIANNKNAFNEEPYKDIAGYAILGTANAKENTKNGKKPEQVNTKKTTRRKTNK